MPDQPDQPDWQHVDYDPDGRDRVLPDLPPELPEPTGPVPAGAEEVIAPYEPADPVPLAVSALVPNRAVRVLGVPDPEPFNVVDGVAHFPLVMEDADPMAVLRCGGCRHPWVCPTYERLVADLTPNDRPATLPSGGPSGGLVTVEQAAAAMGVSPEEFQRALADQGR